jgi:glycerol-3-phosphate acyltransferase PlsX
MTVIALDAMGGDFAPRVVVEGAVRAVREPGARILLVGDRARIAAELTRFRYDADRIAVHHTPQHITMDDASTAVLREKPEASVRVACDLVRQGRAQAVVSAGHSGALMVAAKHTLGMVAGVDRPAIATALPLKHGSTVLIDCGANVDCKPHYLVQFAQMGGQYARRALGVAQPRVGLLSNGGEEGKGNELTRNASALLEAEPRVDFIGNVEARDLFRGKADVVVCDGFVGNLVLKTAEAAGAQLRLLTREAVGRSPLALVGYWLMQGTLRGLTRRTDYHAVGGSPLLGLQGLVVVCHGSSSARSIANALRVATQCASGGLVEAIAAEFGAPASPAA